MMTVDRRAARAVAKQGFCSNADEEQQQQSQGVLSTHLRVLWKRDEMHEMVFFCSLRGRIFGRFGIAISIFNSNELTCVFEANLFVFGAFNRDVVSTRVT
jgi:hypothetical protein